MDDSILTEVRHSVAVAPIKLQFQTPSHHGLLPGPDNGAMICIRGPVSCIYRLPTVCRVSYKQTNRGKKASRERPHYVIGCLVDKAGQLGLVGAIHEEEAEAIICVHDLDLGKVIITIEGQSMEDDLAVDEIGLVWAGKGTVSNILLDSGSSFSGRYRDLEELERFVFPDSSVRVCQCTPV